MNRKMIFKLVVVVAAIVLAAVFLYPSVSYYRLPVEKRLLEVRKNPNILRQIYNLGLDLQGGMRLVLEVDRSKLKPEESKDVLDRAYTIIENRINALGVAEPTIQKQGSDRLIVELPGLKDEAAAKAVIGRTAQLQFNLVREPAQLERAVRIVDKVLAGEAIDSLTGEEKDSSAVKEEEAQLLAERVFGGSDRKTDSGAAAPVKTQDELSDAELLAGVTSFRSLLTALGDQVGASLQHKAKIDAILRRRDVNEALARASLNGNMFLWSHDTTQIRGVGYKTLYYLRMKSEMPGDVIRDAWHDLDRQGLSGGYMIDLELNKKGARRFATVTGANVGKNLAIVLDSTVYSAPVIKQKIPFGRAQISGSFSLEEARSLAIVLRAGALPAPLTIVEERTIGPSLGQDSIRRGVYGAAVGMILVLAFMAIYYGVSGLIANFVLLLNVFFVLAIMAGMNATLTLPGLAGLVLMVGMAVDANVIIFERIREELRLGKTVRSAIATGYSRAFLTIFDANVTTLLTGFILLWIGTGPIKGFAVTLILGITMSFFTAIFVSRVMFDLITSSPKVTKISI